MISVPDMRTTTGKARPHFFLILSQIAFTKRMRFSMLPPQMSVRLFCGPMNWLKSQPWPAWIVTMPKPQNFAVWAASPNFSMVSRMTSSGIAFTSMPMPFTQSIAP